MDVIIPQQNRIQEIANAFHDWFNQLEELNEELESPGKPSSEILYRKITRAMKGNDSETYKLLCREMNNIWLTKLSTQQKMPENKIFL